MSGQNYIMAFRSPENVQRNELVQFRLQYAIRAPANTQEQNKKGYKFHVTDRGIMLDWFNAFFEVRFKLDLKANGGDNADARTTIINGSHSLIKHMVIKSAGKIVYDTDNLHLVTFAKNLLEYSDDFGRSTAKNSLWYLDTDRTSDDTNTGLESRRLLTENRAHVNTSIPLNRYSFFEELEGRLLPPMDLQFEIELTPDAEVLYGAVDTLRLVIDRFYLWVPRLEPKDALMTKFISEYQKPSKWKYLKEMYQTSDTTRNSGDFRISASIDKVKHVFLYFQRLKTNDMSANPYIFDTFKLNAANDNSHLTTCRLEYGNGVFYPELEYDTESKTRIYYDLMNYSWQKNDYNTGTQLNITNFSNLYPMLYFDLTYQTEQVSRDPKQLNIRFRLSQAAAADFRVHAIVLYEEDVVVDKVGDQLVIV